jgi:hypothetical protein
MRTGPSRPSPAAGSSVTMSATPRALMPFRLARHAARRVFGGKQAPQRGFGGGHLAPAPRCGARRRSDALQVIQAGRLCGLARSALAKLGSFLNTWCFWHVEVSNCRSDALHPVSGDLHGWPWQLPPSWLSSPRARDVQYPVRRPCLFADVRLVGHWCAQRPPSLACGLRRRACQSRSSSAGCQTRLQ